MLAALALFWLLGVSVEVRIEGPTPAGHAVSASDGATTVGATSDAEGRARLDVPAGAPLALRIDGKDAGEFRTPPAGSHASVAIPWPPRFTVRLEGAPAAAGTQFRVVPLADGTAREVALDGGALRIDWLLPGDRFDLHAPDGAGGWLWFEGPFVVAADTEETVVFHPALRLALPDPAAPESARVLDVAARQLADYLTAHPGATPSRSARRPRSRPRRRARSARRSSRCPSPRRCTGSPGRTGRRSCAARARPS